MEIESNIPRHGKVIKEVQQHSALTQLKSKLRESGLQEELIDGDARQKLAAEREKGSLDDDLSMDELSFSVHRTVRPAPRAPKNKEQIVVIHTKPKKGF